MNYTKEDFFGYLDHQEQAMGEALTGIMTFSISKQTLTMAGKTYHAKSGPWGKGSLPVGQYKFGSLIVLDPKTCDNGFVVDGLAYVIEIIPTFGTDRTSLYIHLDGNVPGTLGCIGIVGSDVKRFLDNWNELAVKPVLLVVNK